MTPRDAVRNTDGREAVEALLVDAERMGEKDPCLARELRGLTRSRASEK